MRILGIRLRLTIAVALALATYAAIQPQHFGTGRNLPPAPQTVAPIATPPGASQAAIAPQTPATATTAPSIATPSAVAVPPPQGPQVATGGTPTPAQPPVAPDADEPPSTETAETTTSGAAIAGRSTAPTTPTPLLTPAQRETAQRSPTPDSALPSVEGGAKDRSGQPTPARAEVAVSTSGRLPAASPGESPVFTRTVVAPQPATLGGPGTGIPIPPKPRFNRGQYLADTALSFRGLPYKWGGASPDTGMDCSGFIVAVLKRWHIDAPHSVVGQHRLGKPVHLAEIQPGDLMFFKNTYQRGLSHVAIYVGDNQFVDAGDEKAGVMLRELGPHGMEHWVDARRLDPSLLPPAPGEPVLPNRPKP